MVRDYISEVGIGGLVFSCYGLYLVVSTVWRKHRQKHGLRWKHLGDSFEQLKKRKVRGFTIQRIAYWIFTSFLCGSLGMIAATKGSPEHWYEVSVIQRNADGDWTLVGRPGNPYAEFQSRGFRDCSGGNASKFIWVGFIAREAIWDEMDGCESIEASGRGFFWKWGEDQHYRRIN